MLAAVEPGIWRNTHACCVQPSPLRRPRRVVARLGRTHIARAAASGDGNLRSQQQSPSGAANASGSRRSGWPARPTLFERTQYYPQEDAVDRPSLASTDNGTLDDWRSAVVLTLHPSRFKGRTADVPPAHVIAAKRAAKRLSLHALWTMDWGLLLQTLVGRAKYEYYNWRRDAGSDVVVVMVVNLITIVLCTATQLHLTHVEEAAQQAGAAAGAADAATGLDAVTRQWGQALYPVVVWSFGENFPAPGTSPVEELFSLVVGFLGLVTFAVLLALVQQVVLDANQTNVRRGSAVYEEGHFLILGFCSSQRDLVVVMALVDQLVAAYAPQGGTTVVVLTQREKLEMEELFRRVIPESRRSGTRLVFRQGSPLMTRDLVTVAAGSAAATIIVSDQSRSPDEADAQSVRCAVLLDELDNFRGLRRPNSMGHVVVEMATVNAISLLRFSCSSRTLAIPTHLLNARRLSKMVKRPFVSWVSQRIWNFDNNPTVYVRSYPELVGFRFGDLPFRLPDATVFGVAQPDMQNMLLGPPPGYVVRPEDHLVLLLPSDMPPSQSRPLDKPCWVPVEADIAAALRHVHTPAEARAKKLVPAAKAAARMLRQKAQPEPAAGSSTDYDDLYAGGPNDPNRAFQFAVVSDSWGSAAEGVNSSDSWDVPDELLQPALEAGGTTSDSITSKQAALSPVASLAAAAGAADQPDHPQLPDSLQPRGGQPSTAAATNHRQSSSSNGNGNSKTPGSSTASSNGRTGAGVAADVADKAAQAVAIDAGMDMTSLDDFNDSNETMPISQQAGGLMSPQSASALSSSPMMGLDQGSRAGSMASLFDDDTFSRDLGLQHRYVPQEYLAYDERPCRLVLLGWACSTFMVGLLRELDHGAAALPKGSEVICLNAHSAAEAVDPVLEAVQLQHLQVTHVYCDPLQRSQLAQAVDLATIQGVMVLCDEWWVDPDHDAANGVLAEDGRERGSVLRLDAIILLVQLNVRKLLEQRGLPPINIICQKVGNEGLTRFEDRRRLPLGISVNMATFAAKMLAQIAHNPLVVQVYCALGQEREMMAIDASDLAPQGVALSWWQLMTIALGKGQVLFGYYIIPQSMDQPIITVMNPRGNDLRSRPRVWNTGDGLLKFMLLGDQNHSSSKAAQWMSAAELAKLAADTATAAPAEQAVPQSVVVAGVHSGE